MKTAILLSLICLTGCGSTQIRHLDAEAFLRQSQEIEGLNSAYKTTYVGKSHSRVYLEYYTGITLSGNGKTIVYWTESDNVSDAQQALLDNTRITR